ncbi:hypothetical protein C8R47DRAFT_459029 [Mycena vitilis]|nr:hypothetical protein C8R47DRAFT_459029 [Mycena vitilis]
MVAALSSSFHLLSLTCFAPRLEWMMNSDVHAEIFRKLQYILTPEGYAEPTENNVTIILGIIADVVGQNGVDWIGRWTSQSNSPRSDPKKATTGFMRKLIESHSLPEPNYQWVIDKFTSSEPILSAEEVENRIDAFMGTIRPALRDFITREQPLKRWIPDPKLPHAEFLRNLGLSELSSDSKPDMLLYHLGSFMRDPALAERLRDIFPDDYQNVKDHILINTSGSGKTRLLLEGLCKNWGLYFTSLVDPHRHGSYDLQNAIIAIGLHPEFTEVLPLTTSQLHHPELSKNRKIAKARIQEMILARLAILQEFCNIIGTEAMTEEHKKRWLLLQLHPFASPDSNQDIFAALSEELRGADRSYLHRSLQGKFQSGVVNDLCAGIQTFVCVVDEAQSAATTYPLAFRSYFNILLSRSILREVIGALDYRGFQKVARFVSGSGMSGKLVQEVLASSIAKESSSPTSTDLGSFDDPKAQETYMRAFMPPDFKDTPEAKRLYERASRWLHGRYGAPQCCNHSTYHPRRPCSRYRFTTSFMRELLAHGFQNPHKLLEAFVNQATSVPYSHGTEVAYKPGFRPTDAKFWSDKETSSELSLTERYKYDFDMLKSETVTGRLNMLYRVALRFFMRSYFTTQQVTTEESDYLVTGIARLKISPTSVGKMPMLTIDEPLVILSLLQWLHQQVNPIHNHLSGLARAGAHEAMGVNSLEDYWAYYFTVAFGTEPERPEKTPAPLGDIFTFASHNVPSWAKKPAKLVSIYRVADRAGSKGPGLLESATVGLLARPSATLGIDAAQENTLQWLDHQYREAFCFPAKTIGPDIMFILELHNGKRIWVAVQSKFGSGERIEMKVARSALESVKPCGFFRSQDPSWNQTALRYLDALPNRLEDGSAGSHSLLRVVAGWPAKLDLHGRVKEYAPEEYADIEEHPLAEINIEHFTKVTKALHTGSDSFNLVGDIRAWQKRQAPESETEIEQPPQKKAKHANLRSRTPRTDLSVEASKPPDSPMSSYSMSTAMSVSGDRESTSLYPSDPFQAAEGGPMAMPGTNLYFGYVIKPAPHSFLDELFAKPDAAPAAPAASSSTIAGPISGKAAGKKRAM